MKIESWIPITLSAISLSFVSVPFIANSSQANTVDRPTDRINFYCGEISDKETGDKIPATVAWVPQRQANIPIVAWTSNNVAAWSPEKRCQSVSAKFEAFYQDGRLNYLTNGEVAGYPIICALLDKQQQCSSENQLFQVRAGTNPEDVVVGLKEILAGKSSESTSQIYQSSGARVLISVSEFLQQAPVIEEQ
jgi:hypothetical protein